MSNVLTTTLPQYVEQNGDKLLRKAILGSETAQRFTLQTGVKTQTALNLLNTNVVFRMANRVDLVQRVHKPFRNVQSPQA